MSAAAADRLLGRALDDPADLPALGAEPVYLVAAGKAAEPMVSALFDRMGARIRQAVVAGTSAPRHVPRNCRWFVGGHPEPNAESVAAGHAALEIARSTLREDQLVVLLSGGASATLSVPAPGLTLRDKQTATRLLLAAGADITSLNTIRKHLSAIKGGRLAAAARARVLTFVLSDVIGDDVSVVGSGPTCPDPTTFQDALQIVERLGLRDRFPLAAIDLLERGARGAMADTLKADAMRRDGGTRVIGSRLDAIEGARRTAEALGYSVGILDDAITGEARVAGREHPSRIAARGASLLRPACILSAGETTVTVTGSGWGGRNQEFALAAAETIDRLGRHAAIASVGTDGVDGPTDAAGAIVDATSVERGRAAGLPRPSQFLQNNDSYRFFERLGDLVVTGPTRTNVGDIQVALVAE